MTSTIRKRNEKMVSSILKTTTAAAVLLALGACQSMSGAQNDASVMRGTVPGERYPIQVASTKEEMTLSVAPHVFALRADDKERVAWFSETYKHVGHGDIWVVAPVGSANSAASIGAAAEIAKVMVERGIDPRDIKMNSYQAAETDEAAPITVQYKRYHAYTRPCGNFTDNLATTPFNQTSANFGCASQSNLAAMVEDSRDLKTPRQLDPADPARRAAVFDSYRSGESSATERTEAESGAASEVGS
jgi:pilus assembly protein CpaD